MANKKSNLVNLLSNLSGFDYSKVGQGVDNIDNVNQTGFTPNRKTKDPTEYKDHTSRLGTGENVNYNKNINPHPIADVEAQYDKLDVDDGQLIKRDIGERYTFSQGDNVSIDGGFLRGGAATKVQRQIEDQKRIGKFLTTPKGALFTIKQAILQNQNADRETNIYNPLSLNKSLIDTLSTRPQRHINEAKIKNAFNSVGDFFNFLVGNNSVEQGRKNGNSVSNNRNVNNLKPDVDTFGGKVKRPRIIPKENFGINIKTDTKIDISSPGESRKVKSYIPFTKSNDSFSGLPRKDKETDGTLFVHEFSKQKSYKSAYKENFKSDLRRQDDIKEEKARDYKSNKEKPSGDLLNLPHYSSTNNDDLPTGTNVLPLNITRNSELAASEFFNITSRGSRKLQVKYGGELGNTTRIDNEVPLPDDFIKFRIRDVVNGRWIIFPAIFTSGISDSSTATYNSINYIGRPDAVHIYQNRTRSVSFGFRVVALNETDIPIIWEKMNALKGLTSPQFKRFLSDTTITNNTRPVAPIINLTIGDMFVDTPGYFTSINVTVANSATWETKDGKQFPHVCDVSCDFTYIGKQTPTMLGKHYEDESSVAQAKSKEFARQQRDKLAKTTKKLNESGQSIVDSREDFNFTGLSEGTLLQRMERNRLNSQKEIFGTTPKQNLSDYTVKFNPKLTGQ
mgnify:FL=1